MCAFITHPAMPVRPFFLPFLNPFFEFPFSSLNIISIIKQL